MAITLKAARIFMSSPEPFYAHLDRAQWMRLAKLAGLRPPAAAHLGKIKERFADLDIETRAAAYRAYRNTKAQPSK